MTNSGFLRALQVVTFSVLAPWSLAEASHGNVTSEMDVQNLLSMAVKAGQIEVVRSLLSKNSNASNARDELGWPPLHWASRNGDAGIIHLLIDHGSKVDGALANGTTALQWAAWAGKASAVKALLERGAEVNHRDDSLRWTALHWASAVSKDTVNLLLDAGADITVRGKDGYTPLHVATLHSEAEAAKLLIEKGAVISARDAHRQTALHLAALTDCVEVAAILLEHGADANAEDDVASPLHYASHRGNIEMIKLLVKAGADVNMVAKESRLVPLHFAVRNDNEAAAKLLLENGAKADVQYDAMPGLRVTPLQMCAARGQNSMVETLLRYGANVNMTDNKGRTAIMLAKENGQKDTVELLMRHGATQPPEKDGEGDSDSEEGSIRVGIFGIPLGGFGGSSGGNSLNDLAEKLLRGFDPDSGGEGGNGSGPQAGKSRFERVRNVSVRFSDVAGCDEAKAELEDIVAFLRDPARFTRLGGRMNRGVLLSGAPGTGKTLLAKAVAGEAGVPFFYASGSDFDEVYAGLGAARVRELFGEARRETPCIVFIDEIDAVGSRRAARADRQDSRQTLNQLLAELDGFKTGEGVVVLAATNLPEVLDPALVRPGRFDRHVVVPLPDQAARAAVLAVHLRNITAGRDVDAALLARATPGFSGADLAGVVNQAALMAARAGKEAVSMADLEAAKDRHLMGAERPTAVVPARSREATAFHEAGHALVASLVPGALPVYRVTVVPRGRSLGMVTQLPEEGGDYRSTSRREYEAAIAVCMGGRAAEELVYGPDCVTDGASRDLEQATAMAAAMVERYGMGRGIPVSRAADADPWWAGGGRRSERSRAEVDSEVQEIVANCHRRALQLLEEHFNLLHALAGELTARGSMSGDDLRTFLRAAGIRVAAGPVDPQPRMTLVGGARGGIGLLRALMSAPARLAAAVADLGSLLLPGLGSRDWPARSLPPPPADVSAARAVWPAAANATATAGGMAGDVGTADPAAGLGDAMVGGAAAGGVSSSALQAQAGLMLRVAASETRMQTAEQKLDQVLAQLSALHRLLAPQAASSSGSGQEAEQPPSEGAAATLASMRANGAADTGALAASATCAVGVAAHAA